MDMLKNAVSTFAEIITDLVKLLEDFIAKIKGSNKMPWEDEKWNSAE